VWCDDRYGPIEGLPALREALLKKCREKNGIEGKQIHITCGGNQGISPLSAAPRHLALAVSHLALSMRARAHSHGFFQRS
jgi:hypothetical protein